MITRILRRINGLMELFKGPEAIHDSGLKVTVPVKEGIRLSTYKSWELPGQCLPGKNAGFPFRVLIKSTEWAAIAKIFLTDG